MDLDIIGKKDLIQAGDQIDYSGIPKKFLSNKYWIELPNKREYPFKYLTREAYNIASHLGNTKGFVSSENNRKVISSKGVKINFYPQNLNFFKPYEFDYFKKVKGKTYRKENPEDLRYRELISPLVKKLNYWAESIQVEDFVPKLDNTWQWSGTFKKYLWIRFYRKGDSKSVYFVLGVNEQGKLNIHLNCQRSNHTKGRFKPLPNDKVKLFDQYLREADYSEKIISKSQLKNYTWESLIEYTHDYFQKYASLYDELEDLVNNSNNANQPPLELYDLVEGNTPGITKSYVNRKRSYTGSDRIDWGKKQAVSSNLGRLGEELVIHFERKRLVNLEFNDKAELVHKKKDGEGYDILSFDVHGKEIYIEVKTTKGNSDEPFYISANEKDFCEDNKDQYLIYRLYNYDYKTKSAQYYIVGGDELIKEFKFSSTNYEVSKN